MKRNKDSSRDLWDNTKHTNMYIRGAPEGKKKQAESRLDDIMVEKFPNLGKETVT